MDFASPDHATAVAEAWTHSKYLVRRAPRSPVKLTDGSSPVTPSGGKTSHRSLRDGRLPVKRNLLHNTKHSFTLRKARQCPIRHLFPLADDRHKLVHSVISSSYKVLSFYLHIMNICTWKIRFPSDFFFFFVNTICTVKTPGMKNKNTFQKDQNNGIKDPDIGVIRSHASFTHATFERQLMTVLPRQ